MALPTADVKDASGATITRNTLPNAGRAAAADSLPTVLSTEDLAALNTLVPNTHIVLVDLSSTDFVVNPASRQLRVGGMAGDVKVDTSGGETVVIPTMQQGETLSICVTKVYRTGTVATNIMVMR